MRLFPDTILASWFIQLFIPAGYSMIPIDFLLKLSGCVSLAEILNPPLIGVKLQFIIFIADFAPSLAWRFKADIIFFFTN